MTIRFPDQFTWGAATASYQIEGAWQSAGKGESIWDRFSHTPGKVHNGDTGDVACDHFNRWREDLDLMRDLGLPAYRFSISWPRILPGGTGKPLESGLDFYGRLVDALLEAGIEPYLTLYHWDLPQALEDRGGWPERATAQRFVDFASVVARRLGNRVRRWATFNEPWVITVLGYEWGMHAPGRSDAHAAALAAHHVLLAHGLAVPEIRRDAPGSKVGIVLNLSPQVPASPSAADIEAAEEADAWYNRRFLDPLAGRGYPAGVRPSAQLRSEDLKAGDLDQIATPIDWLGVNFYSRSIIRSQTIPEQANARPTVVASPEVTEMGWEVSPEALYDLLARLGREYAFPELVITENGAAYADEPAADGSVPDPKRISYIERHLEAAHRAIAAGVPLRGYFAWSLMDNFEWSLGYSKRFGLVHVDYSTLKRTPKTSAIWYRDVIANNGL
jgi:beta-glucosidase